MILLKKLATFIAMVFLSTSFAYGGFDLTHAPFTTFLSKHVQNGVVDYESIVRDKAALIDYLRSLHRVDKETFESWNEADQMAYLTNLYNAETLELIADHYPVDGIKKIRKFFLGPWDQQVVTLFGEKTTLNTIEHQILRKNYNEPRLHFALVCAALSCPPLRSEAYVGESFDDQLEDQGHVFFSQPSKNRVDFQKKIIYLSAIFKWFRGDFEKKAGSLNAFIQPYLPKEAQGKNWEITFTSYDWSLNSQKRKG